MVFRDIIKRPSDGKVIDTGQSWTECYDDTLKRWKVTSRLEEKYTIYESGIVTPGDNTDGYDVKNTGSLFSTVTNSYNTTIHNLDPDSSITIYLNTDNANPITVRPSSSFFMEGFKITNVFIDTEVGHTGNVEVILFG